MALVAYLAIAVAILIAVVVAKLLRGANGTSAIGRTGTCKLCGCKKEFRRCPHCQSRSTDSLPGGV